jgi:hypothetical protein
MSPRGTLRAFAIVCAAALLATACGGDDDGDAETTTTSTSTTTSTTSTVPPVQPKAPLTGLPVTDPAVLARPTLLVKIDNADGNKCDLRPRPQVGLDQADIVIEELVEGGITRFMAAFQSTIPETIGPVRSARSSDIDLLLSFNTPLFAWSGNNGNVQGELNGIKDRFVAVGHSSSAGKLFYRDNTGGTRCAPANLFVHPNELYDFAKDQGKAAAQVLEFRGESDTVSATATAVAGVKLNTAIDAAFVWDAATATWDRYQKRTPHTMIGDVQISPNNVVILDIEYKGSSTAGSPEAVSVGTGPAHVYLDGKVIDGTWKKDAPEAPWTLLDSAGVPIKLTPGRTWLQLARNRDGAPTNLDAAGVAPYTAG